MLTASVKVHLAGEDIVALCDTGSGGMCMGVSLINEDVCSRWRRKLGRRITPNTRKLTTVAGQTLDILGEIVVDFVLNGELIQQEMLVIRGMTQQMILGWDFCLVHRAVVDAEAGVLRFDRGSVPLLSREELAPEPGMVRLRDQTRIPARSEKLVVGRIDGAGGWQHNVLVDPQNVFANDDGLAVARTVSAVKERCCTVQIVNVTDTDLTIDARVPLGIGYPVKQHSQTECVALFMYELEELTSQGVVGEINVLPGDVNSRELPDIDLSKSELTTEQVGQVHELLSEFSDVFSKDRRDIGRTGLLTHSINTGGAAPIKKTPYRLPQSYMQAAEQHVKEMAEDDLIEPSTSPWRAPIVMARKKDGSLRFCTDFRGLNSVTVTDAHPLPRVDAAIDQLSGSIFFSCLDLSSGYWQVDIDPQDREKTAFSVGKGLWQYKVMAMGLKNAPPTFQRLMELALNGVDWQHALVYIDDICLFSTTFEHHLVLLHDVLTKLRAANLKLKPSKCQLFQGSVVFLGHEVSANGV